MGVSAQVRALKLDAFGRPETTAPVDSGHPDLAFGKKSGYVAEHRQPLTEWSPHDYGG
jgi:hypothetical protein